MYLNFKNVGYFIEPEFFLMFSAPLYIILCICLENKYTFLLKVNKTTYYQFQNNLELHFSRQAKIFTLRFQLRNRLDF